MNRGSCDFLSSILRSFILVLLLTCPTQALTILRVDQLSNDPVPDGSTWLKAYPDLDNALNAVIPGQTTQIWVAASENPYRPDTGGLTDPRDATFQLANGLEIYGGFLGLAPGGNESSLDQRDFDANETVLSGDLNVNDVGDIHDPSRNDNAYHVLKAVSTNNTAILDGFTITGGMATGTQGGDRDLGGGLYSFSSHGRILNCTFVSNLASGKEFSKGGGIYNGDGNPTLINCRFIGNEAELGGGMYNFMGQATLTNCTFTNNKSHHATNYGGGAIFNSSANTILIDCSFNQNEASYSGGSIYNMGVNGTSTIIRCTFTDNSASYSGAIDNSNDSDPTITACYFIHNTAISGGAITNTVQNPVIQDCYFENNIASGSGGAICNTWNTNQTSRCTFVNNQAYSGGAVYCYAADTEFTDCAFRDNTALQSGGAIYNASNSEPVIEACLFSGNTATDYGGAIYNSTNCNTTIRSSLFSENTANYGGSVYSLSCSPAIISSTFCGNRANQWGGAIYNNNCYTNIINCLLVGNQAIYGGGMFNRRYAPIITNCSILGNNVTLLSGGIFNSESNPVITNTILWGNCVNGSISATTQMNDSTTSTPVVTYCCIQDNNPNDLNIPFGGSANKNIDDNPLFIGTSNDVWTSNAVYDPASGQTTYINESAELIVNQLVGRILRPSLTSYFQAAIASNTTTTISVYGDYSGFGQTGVTYQVSNYRIDYGSPCIDAGDNDAVPIDVATDLDNHDRFVDDLDVEPDPGNGIPPVVDMGVYEYFTKVPADFDHDGDVDMADYLIFEDCASGPALPLEQGCEDKDLDEDNDVDQSDFGIFQRCFSGTNNMAAANCVN